MDRVFSPNASHRLHSGDSQAMANSWSTVGLSKPKEVKMFNRLQMKRLPFVKCNVGNKFYRAVQPLSTFKCFTKEREEYSHDEGRKYKFANKKRYGNKRERKISNSF